LSRHDGELSSLGRLQLWSAWQATPGFQLYAMGQAKTDDADGKRSSESELQQLAVRYSSNSSSVYFVEIGKFLPPFAIASERRLSTQNPLIGQPEFIYARYPLGIQAAGSSGWFDYRAALVDLPVIDTDYLPSAPDSVLRPDVGFGVSPFTGLRFGIAYTQGAYLNRDLDAFLPPGTDWKDFDQRLWGLELQFSRGYAEFNGELVFSKYDVPFRSESLNMVGYFMELKYTWTPRLYGAVRLQRNEYPFVRHLGGPAWLAQKVTIHDLEIGLGYRFSPDTQLKLAYRRDDTKVQRVAENYLPSGHSVALQLSHHFDLQSWFLTER